MPEGVRSPRSVGRAAARRGVRERLAGRAAAVAAGPQAARQDRRASPRVVAELRLRDPQKLVDQAADLERKAKALGWEPLGAAGRRVDRRGRAGARPLQRSHAATSRAPPSAPRSSTTTGSRRPRGSRCSRPRPTRPRSPAMPIARPGSSQRCARRGPPRRRRPRARGLDRRHHRDARISRGRLHRRRGTAAAGLVGRRARARAPRSCSSRCA